MRGVCVHVKGQIWTRITTSRAKLYPARIGALPVSHTLPSSEAYRALLHVVQAACFQPPRSKRQSKVTESGPAWGEQDWANQAGSTDLHP